MGEDARWSIDHDLSELSRVARTLGVKVAPRRLLSASRDQAAFFGSQFTLLREPWRARPHRLATAYFHGRPGTPGYPEFDECYRLLGDHHRELARVQVTHAEMEDLVLSTGIAPEKVARIRIGVDFAAFPAQTPEARSAARAALELPGSAFVVGTFQKDGTGWGDGRQPKSIKGPDVLLAALEIVRRSVPELHVLLSGPAREYVRSGLERLGIPYRHRQVPRYREIAQLYAALDAYVVPSRQEGGPKGVLEAMASAVPVVTTRVGQAAELVRDGENGWLVEVDDAQALAAGLARVASRPAGLASVVAAGRETARANSYDTQLPLWREFLAGLVDVP